MSPRFLYRLLCRPPEEGDPLSFATANKAQPCVSVQLSHLLMCGCAVREPPPLHPPNKVRPLGEGVRGQCCKWSGASLGATPATRPAPASAAGSRAAAHRAAACGPLMCAGAVDITGARPPAKGA